MLVKTEGIVIRTRDYGEANKIVVLYTREHGKIALMARGAKKAQSRLRGVTQVLTHGQYLYFAGRGMGNLNQGETIHTFHSLHEDILTMSYAAYIVELLEKMTEDAEPNGYLFHLLEKILLSLQEGKDADILCRIFELKLLALSGYRPQLEACVHCGATDRPYTFSAAKGGFLCLDCRQHDPQGLTLSPASQRLLRLFLYFDIDRLGDIRVKKETKRQLERAMRAYLDYHTDLYLKSRQFLEQMLQFENE